MKTKSEVVSWMFACTLGACFIAILLLVSCQTPKKCFDQCTLSVDNLIICEDLCQP